MKKEEKELLLRDLCARLPYGVIALVSNEMYFDEIKSPYNIELELGSYLFNDNNVELKPYLRPMSSMTGEERKEYKNLVAFSGSPKGASNFVDWLNKKMFAYRTIDGKDLFELGLALEAPEGMYKF